MWRKCGGKQLMKKKTVPVTALASSLLAGAIGLQPVAAATIDQNQSSSQGIQVSQTNSVQTQLQSSFVNVKGDKIFYYSRISNPENKTVVLVHGAGGTADSWRAVIPYISPNINVIAVSLPEHGASEGQSQTKISKYAHFMNSFVKQVKEQEHLKGDIVYVGHSMGGAIGIDLATKHPKWMKQLVLITTSAEIHVPQWFLDELKEGKYDQAYYQLGFAPQDPPALLDILMSKVQLMPTEVAYNDFSATNGFNDVSKLNKIKADTLIIGGTEDRMMPEGSSQLLHEKIRHSSLVMVDGASHFITMEQPSKVASLINDFVLGQ
jgi:pimeloyl-ACP methyl ester carboxylesterase